MKRTKSAIVAATLITIGISMIALAVSQHWTFGNGGKVNVSGVEVYWDAAKTNSCTYINWSAISPTGSFFPGDSKTVTLYLYNPGSVTGMLSITYTGWNPSHAGSFLTHSWSPNVGSLLAGELVQTNLTLTVLASVNFTSFNYNINLDMA